jgi:hypothetical protein
MVASPVKVTVQNKNEAKLNKARKTALFKALNKAFNRYFALNKQS